MEFIRVNKDNRTYYGGAQAWFDGKRNQSMGCGIIAAANLIKNIEVAKNKDANSNLNQSDFMELAEELGRKYIHVLPRLGINGIFLSIGMNRYFISHNLPYRARWGTCRSKIWDRIQKMLDDGIPVIMAIGPNNLWNIKRKSLNLYVLENGKYCCRNSTRAHYVTVTNVGVDYITISSWGTKYYVNKAEFMDYCRHSSNFLFSNIMVVSKK